MKYYFAYGSNLNPDRMRERGIKFTNKFSGNLKNWKLIFQTFLKDEDKGTYANIIPKDGDEVEGIIYEVDESIYKLDKFECIPRDYFRENIKVKSKNKSYECIVYIGNKNNLGNESSPDKNYINHLLRGEKYLSKQYFEKLKKVKVL